MANNKISTKSYFVKRLRDGGYVVDKINVEFSDEDSRRWVVLIDNGVGTLFATCHKDGSFSFYDGKRFAPSSNLRIRTDSIEVIVELLNGMGFVNKHPHYSSNPGLNFVEDMEAEPLLSNECGHGRA